MNKDALLTVVFLVLTILLYLYPTGFEDREPANLERTRGVVTATDDSEIFRHGIVKTGVQGVELRVLDGRFAGQTITAHNELLGQMDRDKIFRPGDTALVVLTLKPDGSILAATPQSHYRIGYEVFLLALLAGALVLFGGWTGVRAMLSFLFAALAIWKILVPGLLKGWDPVHLSLGVVATLTAGIIFLVAGPTRKGVVAFLGTMLGILTSCVLAEIFVTRLHLHGAIMPFAETLLYSGYGHLDLTRIFVAAVFLASSGAVMDLSMDVAASMEEVLSQRPDLGRMQAFRSGLRVGRAVVGTMTTTLLLAYSGGYITLLMAFMAQGIPLTNTFNLIYVAGEVLKTLVGSFGLVMVAPFTALVGALLHRPAQSEMTAVARLRLQRER